MHSNAVTGLPGSVNAVWQIEHCVGVSDGGAGGATSAAWEANSNPSPSGAGGARAGAADAAASASAGVGDGAGSAFNVLAALMATALALLAAIVLFTCAKPNPR